VFLVVRTDASVLARFMLSQYATVSIPSTTGALRPYAQRGSTSLRSAAQMARKAKAGRGAAAGTRIGKLASLPGKSGDAS